MSNAVRIKQRPSRVGSFALVVIIFIGLGPLVGGLAVWVAASIAKLIAANGNTSSAGPIGYSAALFLILFFGYVIGISFAFVAGVIVAAAGIWTRWNDFFAPIVAAAVASAAGTFAATLYSRPIMHEPSVAGIFPICLIATFVCWYFTRGIVRATWQSAD